MLTKGGFTRDEWDHLLHLLNIMNFSMFSCSLFLSNRKQSTMSKIIQGRKTREEPAVAKPRSTCLISRNLFNQKYTSSLVSDASDVPGDPQLDSESVFGSTGKLARNKDQNPATCSQERKKDIPGEGTCGKLQRGFENQLDRTRINNHNVQISDYRYVDSLWERETEIESSSGQSNVGSKSQRIDLEAMSTTMKSAVRVGLQYQENLVAYKNTNFEELKTLFEKTLRLIVEQSSEILSVSTMIFMFSPWMRTTLCHDQDIKWAKAKVHVYSAQYPRSSIELAWWVIWTDAWSDIPGSGQIHFKSEWSSCRSRSARSWFLGTKPNENKGSRGKLLAWSLSSIQDKEFGIIFLRIEIR